MLDAFGPPKTLSHRTVVVTGLGVVCALGVGVQRVWQKLQEGGSGAQHLQQQDLPEAQRPAHHAFARTAVGRVDTEELRAGLSDFPHPLQDRRTAPFVTLAQLAAAQALQDARWAPTDASDRDRSGVAIGSGLSFTSELAEAGVLQSLTLMRRLGPHFVPKVLGNMASGNVSMSHGLRGPNLAPACAGAAGAQAIADAFRLVRDGTADVMVAGGAEACTDAVVLAALSKAAAHAAGTTGEDASGQPTINAAAIPGILGDGAAVLVLEEHDHARARGAHVYAEVRGCGTAGEVQDVAWSQQQGPAVDRAASCALREASLQHTDIGYALPHALPMAESREVSAIRQQTSGVCSTDDTLQWDERDQHPGSADAASRASDCSSTSALHSAPESGGVGSNAEHSMVDLCRAVGAASRHVSAGGGALQALVAVLLLHQQASGASGATSLLTTCSGFGGSAVALVFSPVREASAPAPQWRATAALTSPA